jgi:hypothetical protein
VALLILALAFAPGAEAVETEVSVRVISKGAKFVGTSMGGVAVTLRDADTGEILATGVTAGSTGDTQRIMREPLPHHAPVSTEGAAVYEALLDLDEPRRIEVTARGPLGQPQAIQTVSATQWVVPGKPVTGGDAFVLELPGFVVDVLGPPAHVVTSPGTMEVRANVTMMCGCPIEPGGLWDADGYEVAAIVRRNGERIGEVPLEYAGSTSQFRGEVDANAPGAYELVVYAYDPANGNTGLDRTTFIVR